MNKIIQAFLAGIFFTFILDFFLFLGIYQNYIRVNNIDVYYNILFADNQNIYLISIFSLFIGFIVIYIKNKITLPILFIIFLLVSLTLFEDIGNAVAKKMLMQENVIIKWKDYTYNGDIYYDGREVITFYDYELKKTILLNKQEIQK